MLSDVHAAKDDKPTAGTSTSKPDEDKDDDANAPCDVVQAQSAVVVVAAVPVAALDPTPHVARSIDPHVRAAERDHHDEPNASDPVRLDAEASAGFFHVPAVVAPVAAAPQTEAPPAPPHAGSATEAVGANGIAKRLGGTRTGEKPVERGTSPLPALATDVKQAARPPAAPAASRPSETAVTSDRFVPRLDRQRDADAAPVLNGRPDAAEAESHASAPVPPVEPRAEQTAPAPVQRAAVQSALKEQMQLPAPSDLQARDGPASPATIATVASAPQPVGRDVAAQTSTPTAVRRATSRAAAQSVLDKVVRQGGSANELAGTTATAPAAAATVEETARVAPPITSGSAAASESSKQAGKLTVARAQVGDSVSLAAAVASSHADTAAGEHRSPGRGPAGQDAAPQIKLTLVSAAGNGVVVASPDLRQAFDRMVHSVSTAGSTLDASSGAAVTDQIVRGMQLQMKGNVGEARITLAPEHLGEVVVEMRVERDGVVATLRADTPAVRGWLATHQDDLRAGLAEVGLRLDDLKVSERDSQRGRQQSPADQQPQTPRRPRRTSTGDLPRFEVEA